MPAVTPVKMPELFIEAKVASLVAQVPPVVMQERVVVFPEQTEALPLIG